MQNLQVLGTSLAYLVAGLVCWGLAMWRIRACMGGQRLLVSGIVLSEELISLGILYLLVADRNILGALAYAIGGALGAWLAMRPNTEKHNGQDSV